MLHPAEGNTSRAQPFFFFTAGAYDDDRVSLLRAAPVRALQRSSLLTAHDLR